MNHQNRATFLACESAPGHSRGIRRRDQFLTVSIALVAAVGLASCRRQPADGAPASSYGTNPVVSAKPHLLTVPANQIGHVRIVGVTAVNLVRRLRLPGSVSFNAFETTPVITQVGGPVTRVLVEPGQFVRAGQALCTISSPDFSALRAAYLKARDTYALAQRNQVRAKDLYAHHAIAEESLLNAQTARNQALADLQQARQSLIVLGVKDPGNVEQASTTPEIAVRAPISGEVVERFISLGQVCQGGSTECFLISNMSTVWVVVNVFQRNLGEIHLGERVTIKTDAYPKDFHGRISYISPALDPATRTLQVRVVAQNPGLMLKKGMYVTAVVQAGMIPGALVVPDSAVLRNDENQEFVYLEKGSGQFSEQLVSIGVSEGGSAQVLSGLKSGDRVVGNGALFLQFANSRQR